ncbi:MAG: phosphoglucosamine mutase [Pyrinomonadaceae bacterium]|jgi:phosphoglucosamine mutase|nr:phosphoglucosamine mutase [Pyrinomonadaceae bacterium]
MKRLFGTDGMRGEAGKFPLDPATLEIVGASLANRLAAKLGRTPLLVIGRDTRESGQSLEQSLQIGARRAGADSKAVGIMTTPGVAYLTRTLPADAGVVISASHNAYQDNGIKIFAPSGRKLDDETERLIERDIFSQSEYPASGSGKSSAFTPVAEANEMRARYLDFLARDISRGLSLSGIRLVLDCANGAASTIAPELFERLGANVAVINNTPDGRNINLGCGSLHTEALQHEVARQQADLGVAFDGDADRALFVDAHGRLIDGDASLWILARYLRARHELKLDTVVATVMSNLGLELAFQSAGIKLVRTDVGDKYVLEELLRLGASLGGEQSGHIIFPEISLAGDGLITTIGILQAMAASSKPLHDLTDGLQTFPQILINVPVKVKRPFAEVPKIQTAADELEATLGSRGRLLLRYSGTESLARIMIEGESQSEIEQQADELASLIQEELGA